MNCETASGKSGAACARAQGRADSRIGRVIRVLYLSTFLCTLIGGLTAYSRSGYLTEMGLTESQYGYLLAFCGVVMVFSHTALGHWIDTRGSHRVPLMKAFTGLSMLCFAAFILTKSIALLAAFTVLEAVSEGSFNNIERALVAMTEEGGRLNKTLGRYKLAGSVGWIIASTAFGYLLAFSGMRAIFIIAGALLALRLVLLFACLPKGWHPGAEHRATGRKFDFSALRGLDPKIFVLLAVYLLICLAQRGGVSYVYLYLKNVGHVGDSLSGWIISVSGYVEIPLLFGLAPLMGRWRKDWLFAGMVFAASSRWVLINFVSNEVFYFGIQALQAVDFCATMVVMVAMVVELAPPEKRGVALGMAASIASVGGILGPMLMGLVIEAWNMKAGMAAMGACGMLAAAIFSVYILRQGLRSKRKAMAAGSSIK